MDGTWATIKARGTGTELCSPDVIHYYDHPSLAVMFNVLHMELKNPILVEITIDKVVAHDGLKGGCKCAKVRKILPIPKISREKKVEFAIRVVKFKYKEKTWNSWANNWLNGKDRSSRSAEKAATLAYMAADSSQIPSVGSISARAAEWAARAAMEMCKRVHYFSPYELAVARASLYAAMLYNGNRKMAKKTFISVLKKVGLFKIQESNGNKRHE